MAQYLLSVWHDHDYVADFENTPPDVLERLHAQVGALNEDMQAKEVWVFGGGLVPASSATVVRPVEDGDVSITDGPYTEAKEMMGGFWVIEVPDLDSALEWTRRASLACEGAVELRPFQDG